MFGWRNWARILVSTALISGALILTDGHFGESWDWAVPIIILFAVLLIVDETVLRVTAAIRAMTVRSERRDEQRQPDRAPAGVR